MEIRLILFVVSLLLLFFQCSRSFCAFISPQILSLHPHKLTWYRLYQRENEIMISQIFSSSTLTRPDFLTSICTPSKKRQNYVPFIAWWDVFDFFTILFIECFLFVNLSECFRYRQYVGKRRDWRGGKSDRLRIWEICDRVR